MVRRLHDRLEVAGADGWVSVVLLVGDHAATPARMVRCNLLAVP